MRLCLMILALVLGSSIAVADDSGTYQGKGFDRLSACKQAKDTARRMLSTSSSNGLYGFKISIEECDCEEDPSSAGYAWTCNVDGEWVRSSSPSSTSNAKSSSIEVKSVEAKGTTEAEGCANAKYIGERSVPPTAKIRGFENCSCSLTDGSSFRYVCSVDVHYELQ